MKVTWVPSKKAIEAGNVPADYSVYDIDTDSTPIPESSMEIMLTRSFRHMFNNEAASAWLAETKKDDGESDKAKFLDGWRRDKVAEILDGKLGMRRVAVGPVYSEEELEARLLAFARVKAHITKAGGEFPYKEMNARSLAKEYDGKTVEEWIGDLLNVEVSKRAAKLWETARENVAKRHEQAAEEDDDDVFGAAEEESETEDAE